ncbi:DASH complex subunit dam1 [Aspergillus wentii]|nr:DASH complex subunit dam1 [Aspergillus wentii]
MMDASNAPLSSSRPQPSSRPTTPLRPSSRSSFREAHGYGNSISNAGYTQPAINALEPQFAELADSMADLEANFMHLQLMHESLTRFSESFASFLYGMNMNAFCVDFPEAPITESFRRAKQAEAEKLAEAEAEADQMRPTHDGETTFMTTDTSILFPEEALAGLLADRLAVRLVAQLEAVILPEDELVQAHYPEAEEFDERMRRIHETYASLETSGITRVVLQLLAESLHPSLLDQQ